MCSVTPLCLTLYDPMDYSPPGSSVHRISQSRILEWGLPFLPPGDIPHPGSNPCLLGPPAMAGGFFTPIYIHIHIYTMIQRIFCKYYFSDWTLVNTESLHEITDTSLVSWGRLPPLFFTSAVSSKTLRRANLRASRPCLWCLKESTKSQ